MRSATAEASTGPARSAMTLPDQTPKLPKWFFLLSDALLIAVAAFIASHSATPLSPTVIFAIVGCVATGAVITALAFVADYTRRQDEALDDRQRALESLARTVASSAEQISIAASGLHEIADLVQKNLRHAEHLPHKLQEKIAEFQVQLANAKDVEKEELEKELAALRTTESERLESLSDKIARSAAEWTKLEAATQKHFTAAFATLDAKLTALESAAKAAPAAAPVPPPPAASAPAAAVVSPPALAFASAPAAAATPDPSAADLSAAASPKAEGTAHPPKRPRKPRRESAGGDEATAAPAAETNPPPAVGDPLVEEPPPIPAATIPEITPAAPQTKEPFADPVVGPPPGEPSPASSAEAAAGAPKPARKRAPKKSASETTEPALSLDIDEPSVPASGVVERVLTSDGATRLLVTAYIGIGNRLFVRGEGPGLSWSKGVPLQFVSIGKWRWETNAATAPVKFKLYKNDDVECAALGTQSLDPGHQHEVTAAF